MNPLSHELGLTERLTLNCRGRLMVLDKPKLMGILNITPDSFSDGGKFFGVDAALAQAEKLLMEGADILDIGGASSRPGSPEIPAPEELRRVLPVTEAIRARFPEAILSTDTFRAEVAQAMLDRGAHMVNDISAGLLDPAMLETVARAQAPMILMHMKGNPQTMQQNPQYKEVVGEVYAYFVDRVKAAQAAGIRDLVLDPGFGFGKTLEHNYSLFQGLPSLMTLGLPVLVGISRKSMLWKLTGDKPDGVGDLSAALHLQALLSGAKFLRVHEPAAARRIVQLYDALRHGTF